MNCFNLLTSSIFIIYGFIGFAATSSTPTDWLAEVKSKMELYVTVYNHDGTTDIVTELNTKFPAPTLAELNAFPHRRSALHRAIEFLNYDLVNWLVTKGADFKYGLDDTGSLLPARERAGKPKHLIGHLEEYYRPDKIAAVKDIMTLFQANGLKVCEWPVKDKEFFEVRKDWGLKQTPPLTDCVFDENSTMASLSDASSSSTT